MAEAVLIGAQSAMGQGLDYPIAILAMAVCLVGLPLFGAGVYWATNH